MNIEMQQKRAQTESAHADSVQRVVSRQCANCKHWSARDWVTPEQGVCWMHYGIAKAADSTCERWNTDVRHSPPMAAND